MIKKFDKDILAPVEMDAISMFCWTTALCISFLGFLKSHEQFYAHSGIASVMQCAKNIGVKDAIEKEGTKLSLYK